VLGLRGWVSKAKRWNDKIPTEWEVNPAVHDGRFAQIAETERVRRAGARENILREAAVRQSWCPPTHADNSIFANVSRSSECRRCRRMSLTRVRVLQCNMPLFLYLLTFALSFCPLNALRRRQRRQCRQPARWGEFADDGAVASALAPRSALRSSRLAIARRTGPSTR